MPKARKLKSGSWRCQVYVGTEYIKMPDGTVKERKKRKSFTVSDPSPYGKKECERQAAMWAAEREHEEVEDITLSEAIDRYITARSSVLSPRTVASYSGIKKNYFKNLMNKKITRITQEDIQKETNKLSLTLSPKTVRNAHGLLTAVMGTYCPNFAIHTVLPKSMPANIYIPSDGEIQRLMACAENTNMDLPILLAAFGPMRRGEICALMSEDIDGNTVHVRRNMVKSGDDEKWTIKAPKSYAGDRYIVYPDFVAEKWKGMEGRIVNICPDTVTKNFEILLKKAGLPHFRFHDLRHYAASIQHAIGIPDAYIMQRGGWGNDSTLKNVYRHAIAEKQNEMDKKANNYFTNLADSAHESAHEN